MARGTSGKLTALAVSRATKRGLYGDGHGLYLQVSANGSRSWILRFKSNARVRHHGLGPLHTIGLAEARLRASEARKLILDGRDPIEVQRERKVAARLDAAKTLTFDDCAKSYIAAHSQGWKNAKHAAQWSATLSNYASPVIGRLPVASIDTGLVMRVLQPLWTTKPETAGRLRGRIENILDWAKVRGYREGENPARWKGHLDHLLAARTKKVVHHAALPYDQIPLFITGLRQRSATAARALELAILTAARTTEVLNVTWDEIDHAKCVWTIPEGRMKAGREHKVPLSKAALRLVEQMQFARQSRYIFPGMKKDRPLSNMAMLLMLRRMGREDLTTHGFRSSFRDWCAEQTSFPSEAAEMALAHTISDKVEAAYRRGDLFEKRRRMMEAWGAYCDSAISGGSVIKLRGT